MEALLALRRESKEQLWSSMIKDTMKRKKPSFNEAYHGYRTFSELLEDAAREGLLELETDKRSRTYVVTRFGAEMTAAPPPPGAEGILPPKKKSRRRRSSGKRRVDGLPPGVEPAALEAVAAESGQIAVPPDAPSASALAPQSEPTRAASVAEPEAQPTRKPAQEADSRPGPKPRERRPRQSRAAEAPALVEAPVETPVDDLAVITFPSNG